MLVYITTHVKRLCMCIYRVGPEPYTYTVYDRIFGDFPARSTVYTPYIYGPGQPYVLYIPKHDRVHQGCSHTTKGVFTASN